MNSKHLISRDIELFYNKVSEETRLNKGMGIFEFERIKSLIEKYLSSSTSKIIDVGGGTGKYSEWLAKKGHQVHLIEPILKHIEIATNRANKLKNKFSIQLGESRKLELPNNYADLIILHGPLYHLQKKENRDLTIREAKRVLKNNGIILGFAINYTASTLVGLLNGLIHKKTFFDMCKQELTNGIHNPPDDFPWLLAEAYYHKPEQLKQEFVAQELTYLNTYAVEGMSWLDKDYFASMLNDEKKKTLLELIKLTENDNHLLSFSPHMMIAVKK
ncbi:class I SAM-dependent methyltransferase [Aquimarina sp. BL5]|uniref:class I SAM-dependent methyltransferase n=1 Tax=Aquimarina sp. BL5 TaxID=1714860 RepID=UPI000E48C67F|nr:class I SAM-dependent methyltransferase [Aquimarina sp. BL5]AXT52937.1 class I SAM-dependent methyltransferase [Aquimarina sp. BL5]RKN10349.1 methyltransferase domain-containing protein [Aquimarina sp. BL5]